jgi:hypothetical protein
MHGEVDQIVPFSMGKKNLCDSEMSLNIPIFTKYDDHMMEFDEKLILALELISLKRLN